MEKEKAENPVKKSKDLTSSSELSSNDVFEIMTRLSLDTLGSCKQALRHFCEDTYTTYFTSLHCERARVTSGYFLQSMVSSKYYATYVSLHPLPAGSTLSLDFLPCDVKIEASSRQGLLCCTSQGRRIPHYYICKPTTRQWKRLPNPRTRFVTVTTAMAVQSNTSNFIIVRLSQHCTITNFLCCEIFDSRYNAWKLSRIIHLPNKLFLLNGPVVLVDGAFHWLTDGDYVFSFDFTHEDWWLIPLPFEIRDETSKRLVQYEGQLALCRTDNNNDLLQLWVLTNYSNVVWEKQKEGNLVSVREEDRSLRFGDLYTSDMALMNGLHNIMWYNHKSRNSVQIKTHKYLFPQEVFRFQSDFERSDVF